MGMECANEDLLVFNEFSCDLLDFNQKKRILFFSLKKKKKGGGAETIKLLTEVSETKTRKYNVLNLTGPNHSSCCDSS